MKIKLSIAVLTALLLVACGKEAPTSSPAASAKPTEAATSPAAGPAPASAASAGALDDQMAQVLMSKAGCVACHTVDKKLVGPAYKDVAAKRKDEKDVAVMLAAKVRGGGVGAYGQIPMPPNPKEKISDDELKAMIQWVLTK